MSVNTPPTLYLPVVILDLAQLEDVLARQRAIVDVKVDNELAGRCHYQDGHI